ncbi:MAG: MgtC/SapB family protein [Chloroflexi bacterium]|nr:MAG: MgtC/SapB family protein [Chloroflexota bacterium]RLC95992.1 MAG: MgtC/SapB family protein [Chloroflexota bacterium]
MEIWQLTPWDELDMVIRLLISALVGGLIGYERERAEKPAGLRTIVLVSVGATLFTLASINGFGWSSDPSRVAAGIVVGIGFLGAGTILRGEGGVVGLTTAATIWSVAAIGLALGAGLYLMAVIAAIIVLGVLRLPAKHVS